MMLSTNALAILPLLPWAALWLVGGWLIVQAVFTLHPHERWLTGFALGWFVQVWFCNLFGILLPLQAASCLAACCVFFIGLVLWARQSPRPQWRSQLRWDFPLWQLAIFGIVTYVYFRISRGMAIFDDFQHLATVSLIAAGDFPPRFALDPTVRFGYHHFLQLFASQFTVVGGLAVWAAVDAARAFAFGLAVLLGALWAKRLTGSAVAGWLGGLWIALAGGSRWLLLLLPRGLVARLGAPVTLLGSGAGSGPNLQEALLRSWAVEGVGPTPLPFAFANGIFPPGVIMGHTANGLAVFACFFLLLLTAAGWKSRWSAVFTALVVACFGLLGEAELVAIAAGVALLAVACCFVRRSLRLSRQFWAWLAVIAAGVVIGLLAGGAWTDMLAQRLASLLGQAQPVSYQTVGFALVWPPAVVSSHLGPLALLRPATLLLALFEMGPVVLILPLLLGWGWQAQREQRWFEAAAAGGALFSLALILVNITGSTGIRNTPRLYVFLPLCAAFAVPLGWRWAAQHSHAWKAGAAVLYGVGIFGGAVMLGAQLTAMQQPVYSSFLTVLDARMAQAYWNRLEPGVLVFDRNPYRAPVVFGRPTDSSTTWYLAKPEWQRLADAPAPQALRAYGFRYAYFDERSWEEIGLAGQQAFSEGCAQLLGEQQDGQNHFRRLFDLQNCTE